MCSGRFYVHLTGTPLIVTRAEGLYYWDVEGKRYFDAIGGIFVAVLDHRHPRVMDATRTQMAKLTFAPPIHGISDVTLEFVEKPGSVVPGNMFAAQTFGVTPDIMCVGKGISSGAIPLAAMIAREDMAVAFLGPSEAEVQFAHGHTYAGNPRCPRTHLAPRVLV